MNGGWVPHILYHDPKQATAILNQIIAYTL